MHANITQQQNTESNIKKDTKLNWKLVKRIEVLTKIITLQHNSSTHANF